MPRERHILGVILGVVLLLSSGCVVSPLRVGQAKVPGSLREKPPITVEAERQAADLLARDGTLPEHAKESTRLLSASLGPPKSPIKVDPEDPPEDSYADAEESLRKGLKARRTQEDKLNDTLDKYEGKKIEGTGLNLTLPFGLGGTALLVAALIFIPGLGTILLYIIRRLASGFKAMVQGIAELKTTEPEAYAKVKASMDKNLDRAHKKLVASVKRS